MTFSPLILILSAVLVLVGVATPFINPLFRRPSTTPREESPSADGPGISILLVSRGNPVALDEHLPIFLTQEYAPGYEVIVVADKTDDETGNVLKRYAGQEKLYSTFIPASSRYMSKNKLGATLGVKAAKNDWIVMVDPACKPESSHWLQSLSRHCGSHTNMVLGYTHFNDEAPRMMGFEHLHNASYLLRSVEQGHPYRTNCSVLAFRKQEFLEGYGFQGNLKYSIGEYDFLVNKFGRSGSTVTALEPDSWLLEDTPSKRTWQNRKVYYQEVRRHLEKGHRYQVLYLVDQLTLHLTYLLQLCGIAYGALTHKWVLLGAGLLSLVLTLVLRTLIGRKASRALGGHCSWYQIVPFELSLLWHRLATMIRYEYADKSDFISQKV